MPVTPVVRGRGLSHAFEGTGTLFANLDLELLRGEVVAVVGPSGSGKSTLLALLAGWLEPTAGAVDRLGVVHTGWVLQNPHGVPRRTAIDHVALPFLARGSDRREAEDAALATMARFKLLPIADRQYRALSGGEAQRLMLARAVATGSDLLLVDEPTAQLDPVTASTVNEVLAGLASDRAAVVVATHDPHTRDACTRVIDLTDYQAASAAVRGTRAHLGSKASSA